MKRRAPEAEACQPQAPPSISDSELVVLCDLGDLMEGDLVVAAASSGSADRLPLGSLQTGFQPAEIRKYDDRLLHEEHRVSLELAQAVCEVTQSDGFTRNSDTSGNSCGPWEDFLIPRVIDLGCGAGLSGRAFREMSKHILAIDASREMIEAAKQLDLYDEFAVADPISLFESLSMYTDQPHCSGWDLAVAADVLCCYGQLGEVFDSVASILGAGCLFAFGVEEYNEGDAGRFECSSVVPGQFMLPSDTSRYKHSKEYVVQCAEEAGFEVKCVKQVMGRFDRGQPVYHTICVCQQKYDVTCAKAEAEM